jgi:hypothetical protein
MVAKNCRLVLVCRLNQQRSRKRILLHCSVGMVVQKQYPRKTNSKNCNYTPLTLVVGVCILDIQSTMMMMMNKVATSSLVIAVALLSGSADAFAPLQSAYRASSTSLKGGMEDLKTIAEKSNPVLKVRLKDDANYAKKAYFLRHNPQVFPPLFLSGSHLVLCFVCVCPLTFWNEF